MIKVFLISVSFTLFTVLFPVRGIDFNNKSVLKEIQKVTGAEKPEWLELSNHPSAQNSDALQGKFFVVTANKALDQAKYVYIGRVNSCRQGGCSNGADLMALDKTEYFDYFIVFNHSLSVELVKVYNYQATHGQEVTNKGWLKQFQGYNGSRNLVVGKSIDAISGATVSVQNLTADIQEKTQQLKKLIQ